MLLPQGSSKGVKLQQPCFLNNRIKAPYPLPLILVLAFLNSQYLPYNHWDPLGFTPSFTHSSAVTTGTVFLRLSMVQDLVHNPIFKMESVWHPKGIKLRKISTLQRACVLEGWWDKEKWKPRRRWKIRWGECSTNDTNPIDNAVKGSTSFQELWYNHSKQGVEESEMCKWNWEAAIASMSVACKGAPSNHGRSEKVTSPLARNCDSSWDLLVPERFQFPDP